MKKKWECSECDYNNGRHWNVARHIRTMHYSGSPLLSVRYASKTAPTYSIRNTFSKSHRLDLDQKNQKERDAEVFAESYKFKDPIIGILMQYHKALSLKEGFKKQMIISDLLKQLEQKTTTPSMGFPIHSVYSETLKVNQDSTISQLPFTLDGPGLLPRSVVNQDSIGNTDSRKPIGENGRQKKLD